MEIAADAWTETYVKPLKGGNASDDDRVNVRTTFWPVESDGPEQIALKAQMRANTEKSIANAGRGQTSGATMRWNPATQSLEPVE